VEELDNRSEEERRAAREVEHLVIDRLRVTRELTKNQYNRLIQYENIHGRLSVEEIAKRFNLVKR
jgi:hypothetical protein